MARTMPGGDIKQAFYEARWQAAVAVGDTQGWPGMFATSRGKECEKNATKNE